MAIAVVEMFGVGATFPLQLLAAPIGLQEMVLAVLLILKGFSDPSVAQGSGQPRPGTGSA